jgi:hypothetical protein
MTRLNPSLTIHRGRPFLPASNSGMRKVRKIFIRQVFSARCPLVQRIDFCCVVRMEGFISPSWSTKVKVL